MKSSQVTSGFLSTLKPLLRSLFSTGRDTSCAWFRRRNPVDPSRRRAATGASGIADFRDRLLDLPGLRTP